MSEQERHLRSLQEMAAEYRQSVETADNDADRAYYRERAEALEAAIKALQRRTA